MSERAAHPQSSPGEPETQKHGFLSSGMPQIMWTAFWTFAVFYGPQPLMPAIREEFHVAASTAGLMITMTILPLSVAPLVYGTVLGSISTRRLLFWAMTLLTALMVPPVFAASFWPILLARLGQGMMLPAILLALMTSIASRSSGLALQRNMMLYACATLFGAYTGRIYEGWMGSLFGWRGAFAALALAASSALVAVFLLPDAGKPKFTVIRLKVVPSLVRQKGLRILLGVAAACIFVYESLANFIPFRLRQLHPEISDLGISLIYLAPFLSAFVAVNSQRISLWCGGEKRVVLLGAALLGLFVPCMAARGTVWLFCALLGVSVGFALIYTNLPGIVNRLTRRDKAMTNGVYLSVYYAGSACGTYFPGLIYGSFGWTAYLVSLFCVVAALLALAWLARGISLRS